MMGKWIMTHFLLWFAISLAIFFYVGVEFFPFAVIGSYTVLAVDYIAVRYMMIKYFPFAAAGLTASVILYWTMFM